MRCIRRADRQRRCAGSRRLRGVRTVHQGRDPAARRNGSQIVAPDSAVVQISNDQFGCGADDQKAAPIERAQSPASSLPAALRLGYYDPVLDYQAGEARATSAEKRGTEDQRDLPAAVSAADAKLLVQRMIAREWARRDKLTLRLPPRYLGLSPGARIDLDLSPRNWRLEQSTIDGFVIVAELRPSWSATASITADGGRIVPNEDVAAGDVTLALFDIPDVLEQGLAAPTVMLAASTPTPGWKSYSVEIAAGQSIVQVQTPRRKTVLGTAPTALAPGDPSLINFEGSFDVELIDGDQWLVSCNDDALVSGANLAVIGSELVQFGTAEPLGQGRFRLARLLRGRAGTEWAMDSHVIGEAFALIEPEMLRTVALSSWATGATISASLRNVSGTASNSSPFVLGGEAVRPLPPVALDAQIDLTGTLMLTWTRRSRKGFAWIDGIDAPLGESVEQYRISVTGPSGSIEATTNETTAQIPAAELAGVGSGRSQSRSGRSVTPPRRDPRNLR